MSTVSIPATQFEAAWRKKSTALADWAALLLVNRHDVWGQYMPLDKRSNGSAITLHGELTTDTLRTHFEGRHANELIGVHSTSTVNRSRWLSIDWDRKKKDSDNIAARNIEHALSVYTELKLLGFNPLFEDSNGNGGFHIWIVLSDPIPSELAYRFGLWLRRRHLQFGLEAPEVFPKQAVLSSEKQYGNWMRLPGRHHEGQHWSTVYNGVDWLAGEDAVDFVLSINGDDPGWIPSEAKAHSTPEEEKADAHRQHAAESWQSAVDLEDKIGRARKYLKNVPGAISGQHGHDATYRIACVLVLDFDLSIDEAFPLIQDWNAKCEPPWNDDELMHKLEDASEEQGIRGRKLVPEIRAELKRNCNGRRAENDVAKRKSTLGTQPPPPWQPYPYDLWPDPIAKFINEQASALGCDPCLVAQPLIAALGAAVGNSRRIQLKAGWMEPPVFWTVTIAESGDMKSPAQQHALAPLMERQRVAFEEFAERQSQYEQELLNWETDMAQWKKTGRKNLEPQPAKPVPPVARRIVVSDATIESLAPILKDNPRGVLAAHDELAVWFGSFGRYSGGSGKVSSDVPKYLEAHRAGTWIIDRRTGNPPIIYVRRAAVCLTGGIQPEIFSMALGRERYQDGTAARMLLAMPPAMTKRWSERIVPASILQKIEGLFDTLMSLPFEVAANGDSIPKVLKLDDDGHAAWVKFYNAHAAELAKLTGDLKYAWSKLECYCARIALLIHCIRVAVDFRSVRDPDLIDAASIEAAAGLVAWYGREAQRIYARMLDPEADSEQQLLIAFIRSQGGAVASREVMRAGPKYATAEEAELNLNGLVRAGRATCSAISTKGRPKTVWTLVDQTHKTPDHDRTMANFAENELLSSVASVEEAKTQIDDGDFGEV